MSGFVDTSMMSDLEIKRLSQIDEVGDAWSDPYAYRNLAKRNPYNYNKKVNKPVHLINTYNADDVWTAACFAQRTNGVYVKNAEEYKPQKVDTNRELVDQVLAGRYLELITDEDREQGRKMRKHYQAQTFKILQGKKLNEFNNTAMTIANKDTISSNYDIAVITSLPASYEKATKRDEVDRRINFARGGYVGNLDEKVTVTIEVIKNIYSQKWNTWYVTGITDDDKVLFFAYKGNMNIGDRVTIQGNVKTYRDNSTQLNRVKVI